MITSLYNTLGADEDMPIAHKFLSKAVESAQRRVEGRNFSIRKNVLHYDDVMNQQRELIYAQRKEVLDGKDISGNISNMIDSVSENVISIYTNVQEGEDIDTKGLALQLQTIFGIGNIEGLKNEELDEVALIEEVREKAHQKYSEKAEEIGEKEIKELERVVMLKVVDEKWMNHIDNMDELKNGIGLRAYGQKDPVVQYRIEGSDMFEQMVEDIRTDVVKILLNVHKAGDTRRKQTVEITKASQENLNNLDNDTVRKQTVKKDGPSIGRNDPCPCGSGKKYKQCCGK